MVTALLKLLGDMEPHIILKDHSRPTHQEAMVLPRHQEAMDPRKQFRDTELLIKSEVMAVPSRPEATDLLNKREATDLLSK